jgi:hypothetical protein
MDEPDVGILVMTIIRLTLVIVGTAAYLGLAILQEVCRHREITWGPAAITLAQVRRQRWA